MKALQIAAVLGLMALAIVALLWLGRTPTADERAGAVVDSSAATVPLRIAIIPERDIFEQHRRYRALADYLATKVGRRVELRTSRTYEGALRDLADGEADAAFLGSLAAALAVNRLHVRVLVRPQYPDGVSTYYGVVFTREDSPIRSIADLVGKRVAMVRATTGGHLVLVRESVKAGLAPDCCRVVWVGTHDESVQMVMNGEVDAGAAKNARLEHLERETGVTLRRLAQTKPVPENPLVARRDLDAAIADALRKACLGMADDPDAHAALEAMGLQGFIPCDAADLANVFEMVGDLGGAWERMELEGPAPGGGG